MDEVDQQTFDVWSILILNYKRKKQTIFYQGMMEMTIVGLIVNDSIIPANWPY